MHKNVLFTTADRAAIKTLGILGVGSKGISVEELLKNVGIKRKKGMPRHFTKKWFQEALTEGLSEQHLWKK
jgi:phosphoglycerate dehydrogenase-like enzyme